LDFDEMTPNANKPEELSTQSDGAHRETQRGVAATKIKAWPQNHTETLGIIDRENDVLLISFREFPCGSVAKNFAFLFR
jgi:hypothetical protein